MGDIVDFNKAKKNKRGTNTNVGITFEDFAAIYGSYSNSELMPTYKIKFKEDENWDGKVISIQKLSKNESYRSMLSSGTSGIFITSEDGKIEKGWTAELETDAEELGKGEYIFILVFKEELPDSLLENTYDNVYVTAL